MKNIIISIIVILIIGYFAWNGYQAKQEAKFTQAKNEAFNQCMNDVKTSMAGSRQLDCKIDGKPPNCTLTLEEINSLNKSYNESESICLKGVKN